MMTKIRIGEFPITSGKVVIADPCYKLNNGGSAIFKVVPAFKGEWVAKASKNKEGRIVCVDAYCKDIPLDIKTKTQKSRISVDSGQAGIFDARYYRKQPAVKDIKINNPIDPRDKFYSICCEKTLSKEGFGVLPFGFVSASGYGDGVYDVFMETYKNKVVKIKINFY